MGMRDQVARGRFGATSEPCPLLALGLLLSPWWVMCTWGAAQLPHPHV